MGLFSSLLGRKSIDEYAKEAAGIADARIIDVRTEEEYRQGHIPKSLWIPLEEVSQIKAKITNQDTPLYLYCYSGARSAAAAAQFRRMGYTQVINMGGIMSWHGEIEIGGNK